MLLNKSTHELQSYLAEYCRGNNNTVEKTNENRLHHYRRLVFNNIKNVISSAYPIAENSIGEDQMENLINIFFKKHKPKTAQYWKLPYEFLTFSKQNNFASQLKIPYWDDLLEFEWAEIEIHTMKDVTSNTISSIVNTLSTNSIYTTTPYHTILELDYPVHLINSKKIDLPKEVTYLLVYRKKSTDKVHYLKLNPLSVIIITLLSENKKDIEQLTFELQKITKISIIELKPKVHDILTSFKEKEILFT